MLSHCTGSDSASRHGVSIHVKRRLLWAKLNDRPFPHHSTSCLLSPKTPHHDISQMTMANSGEAPESGNYSEQSETVLNDTVSIDELESAKSQSLTALATDCEVLSSIAAFCDRQSRGVESQTARSTIQTLGRIKQFSQQLEGTNETGVLQATVYFDLIDSELGSGIMSFLNLDSPASTFTRDLQDLQRSFPSLLLVSGNFLAVQVVGDALNSMLAFPPDLR